MNETDSNVPRREFLKGAAAGVASFPAFLRLSSGAAGRKTVLPRVKRRKLGKTGEMVSEIGLGGHSFRSQGGGQAPSPAEATALVAALLEAGVNVFDTTTADERLALSHCISQLKARKDCFLVTRHDFGGARESVLRTAELSLRQFRTEVLDALLVGAWSPAHFTDETVAALEELKRAGKVRFVGFGGHLSARRATALIAKYRELDVVCFPYNVTTRKAEGAMAEAAKRQLGLFTIKPFARGELLRDAQPSSKASVPSRPEALLKFVLRNERVATAFVGMHTLDQARENLAASGGGQLSKADREVLDECQTLASAATAGELAWLRGWTA